MKAVIFLTTSLVAIFSAVSAIPITYESEGNLQVINAGNDVLEAVFYTPESGIRIYGDNSSITILSMNNDEVIMSGRILSNSTSIYSISGSNFLQQIVDNNGEQRKAMFIMGDSEMDEVKQNLDERKEQRMRERLTEQNVSEVYTAENRALQMLLARSEILLLEPAAQALGIAGIMGFNNKGALKFYAVAMAMVKQLDREREGSGEGDIYHEAIGGREQKNGIPERIKRWWGSSKIRCSNNGKRCKRQSCSSPGRHCKGRCPIGDRCKGMCGRLCNCWWFVCLSCCYRHGCYKHDDCCERLGMDHINCRLPLGFTCSNYNCC